MKYNKLFKLIICTLCIALNNYCYSQIRYLGTECKVNKLGKYDPLINGFVWLKSGNYIKGDITFESHSEEVPTGNLAPGGTPITKTKYFIDACIINGETYPINTVAIYGSANQFYVKDYCDYNKKGKLNPEKEEEKNFHPGYIMFNDSVKIQGFLAIREGIIFSKTEDGLTQVYYNLPYNFYQNYRIKHAVQIIDGKEIEYSPYLNLSPVESKKWDPCTIVTLSGKIVSGVGEKIEKSVISGSKVFKKLIFRANNQLASVYNSGEVKSITFPDEGKEYISFEGVFYSKKGLLENVINTNHSDPECNFQPGTIVYYDGHIEKGKISRIRYAKSTGFYFIDSNNDLKSYYADKNIKCFSQNINGVDRFFVRIGSQYTPWIGYGQKVSYFRNPYPTHPKKGLNKFVNFAGEMVSGYSQQAIDTLTARKIQKDFAKNRDIGEAMQTAKNGYEMKQAFGHVDDQEAEFFHTEYVILVNEENPTVVYKNNIKGVMNAFVLTCPDITKFDQKTIDRMEDIDSIEESVKLLNENKCL